eukprot:447342-Alexandrium_andersonii.AAC.1
MPPSSGLSAGQGLGSRASGPPSDIGMFGVGSHTPPSSLLSVCSRTWPFDMQGMACVCCSNDSGSVLTPD